MSSCANYIFPAGKRKVILPGAVVAWHGSPLQRNLQSESGMRKQLRAADREAQKRVTREELEKAVKEMMVFMADVKEKQKAFYERIGVNEYVTRIGNEKYGARGFYFMSVEDMEKFGIKNVTAPNDYPKVDLTELNKLMPLPVRYIKLRNAGITSR